MAEGGMVEGILGGEGEARERDAVLSADAAAIAVAMDEAGKHPEIAGDASAFLQSQRRLVDLQVKHYDAEHRSALQSAKLRQTSDWVKFGLLALTTTAVAAIVLGLGAMVWSASRDSGLIIEAFSVPPDLAQRGLNGRVVATRLQDKLAKLDAQTETSRPQRSYANDWSGDIKIAIPETGVSIGELSRLLHEQLGHATRIDGEIFRMPDGLTASARAGGVAAEASGNDRDLDALLDTLALNLYAQTQPYRYGIWLSLHGRVAESKPVLMGLTHAADPDERFWGWFGLGRTTDDPLTARNYNLRALALKPNMANALSNLAAAELTLGHDEAGLSASRRTLTSTASGRSGLSPAWTSFYTDKDGAIVDTELEDYATARQKAQRLTANTVFATGRHEGAVDTVWATVQLHEAVDADDLAELRAVPAGQEQFMAREIAQLRAEWSAQRGDWAAVAREGVGMAPLDLANDLLSTRYRVAEAYAHLGRDAEADALLRAIPADYYDAWLARGRVAAVRRDWAGAARDFAEAVRQGPSLPRGYQDWGDMLAAKGDLAGAVLRYAEANQRGPNWAEPLKAWGDVLARQGKREEAAAKYDAALVHAPNWAELKAARAGLNAAVDKRG